MNRLFCAGETFERRCRMVASRITGLRRRSSAKLGCTVHRNGPKGISFAQIQNAELSLADARCIFQHGVEHRLEFAGRTN